MSERDGAEDPPATAPSAAGPADISPADTSPGGTAPSGAGLAGMLPADAPGVAGEASDAVVLTRRVVVPNRRGLHARAAAKLVNAAERFGAAIDVEYNGQSVSARSIMGLMMLGAGPGTALDLRAEGWDAREALDALTALIESGFDEQD